MVLRDFSMRFIVLTCFYAMHVMTPCMHVCHDSMQAEMHPESSGQHPHALSRDVPRRRGGGGGPGVPSHVRLAPGDNVRVGQADHREAVRRSGGQGGGRAPPLQGAVVTGEVVKGRRLGASLTRCGGYRGGGQRKEVGRLPYKVWTSLRTRWAWCNLGRDMSGRKRHFSVLDTEMPMFLVVDIIGGALKL